MVGGQQSLPSFPRQWESRAALPKTSTLPIVHSRIPIDAEMTVIRERNQVYAIALNI